MNAVLKLLNYCFSTKDAIVKRVVVHGYEEEEGGQTILKNTD